MKSPPWTREELILALDLYLDLDGRLPGPNHPKVITLSRILNALPIHPRHARQDSFRNPVGVSLKLANFRAVDPTTDKVGMARGSHLDKEVWDEFENDRHALRREALDIRKMADL
jgi:5-methylcytosine-specific restriction protein A